MSKLRHRIFGRQDGNFRPPTEPRTREPLIRLIERIEEQHLPLRIAEIFAPRVNFTTRIADATDPKETLDVWSARLIRAQEPADGALVRGYETAVAIFNGDCPLLCLHQDERLAVLHIGYRCLMRADPNEEGIVEVALRHFNPESVHAFIFGGIGPCCWLPEYDDKPEILDPARSRHPELLKQCQEWTTCSPAGSGHISIDLYALARGLLLLLGISEDHILLDSQCTCCAASQSEDNSRALYWSHTRFKAGKQNGVDGRNCSIAWLEL
ncbi:MAG: hypothetical protein G01um1014106_488 [Parcubacteria group bacterium Gr01-1014_106]|nr:MAG: hypothetical protein G01um1014106_488 [Parcubacteria group bacterium Gr01-1014_106]